MKIICIERNYGSAGVPVFFMKPETALLRCNMPLYRPDFAPDLQCGVSPVLRICRLGRSIAEKFAHRYYCEIGIGIDFAAGGLLRLCAEQGLAWECARAFDYSAAVSAQFVPIGDFLDVPNAAFALHINGTAAQQSTPAAMTWGFSQIIAHVSQFVTLKMGDLIFAGAPSALPVGIGDTLTASIDGRPMMRTEVR